MMGFGMMKCWYDGVLGHGVCMVMCLYDEMLVWCGVCMVVSWYGGCCYVRCWHVEGYVF